MKRILKFKKEIIFGLFLIIFYLFLRIFRLTQIPIFTDEAIYIRWAEIARYDAFWRFISLSDGKQPLFVWLVMVILPLFKDPLFAGRLVSVIAGLGTMIGLFLLGKEIFQEKKVGFFSALLYIFYPFALVYDRMALMDCLVGTFAVWALYFQILLVKLLRLDISLILGIIIGGGMLTKSSGFFNLYLLPFSLLIFPWRDKDKFKKLILWVGLAFLVFIESQLIYAVLRLSPLYHMIAEKNSVFVYPFREWLNHPWRFFIGNFKGLWDWFLTYLSWPVLIILIISLLLSFKKYFKEKILLLIWFVIPFILLALFGKVLYPRFIFFMTLSLLPLIGFGVDQLIKKIKNPWLIFLLGILIFFYWIRNDYQLLINPYKAKIPKADSDQYLNDWPAGGGIKEVVEFLNEKSQKGKIYVGTEGTFGPLPYALEVYLYKNHNIEIRGFWPIGENLPSEVIQKAKEKPTYFVFNQTQNIPPNWPLRIISKYRKGIGEKYLHLCEVINE